jgi:chorismate mutase
MDESIDDLRKKITALDRELIGVLGKRFELAKEIGRLKAAVGRDVVDLSRERELIQIHLAAAREQGVSKNCVREIFTVIMNESKRIQGL